jgi:hypothetical protein
LEEQAECLGRLNAK